MHRARHKGRAFKLHKPQAGNPRESRIRYQLIASAAPSWRAGYSGRFPSSMRLMVHMPVGRRIPMYGSSTARAQGSMIRTGFKSSTAKSERLTEKAGVLATLLSHWHFSVTRGHSINSLPERTLHWLFLAVQYDFFWRNRHGLVQHPPLLESSLWSCNLKDWQST